MTGATTSPEVVLGGLDASKTYNVYLYATKHSTAFKNTATGASRAAIGWTQATEPADFHKADTYAAFRGLTGATSYGFTATGITSQGWNLPNTGIYGMLVGIQIQEVASPGSLRQYWTFDEGTGYSAANRVAAGQAGGWNGETPDWMEGTHYVLFEDVTAAGTLTGTFRVPNGDDYATLSGIQIAVYIPEPGSFLLLTLALMGLSLRRHRPSQAPRP